jgi:hypothetical protein
MARSFRFAWRCAMRDAHLSWRAQLIGERIELRAKDHGDGELRCWPSIALLAADANVGKKTVDKAIVELEQAGFVEIERRPRPYSNRYALTLPNSAWRAIE